VATDSLHFGRRRNEFCCRGRRSRCPPATGPRRRSRPATTWHRSLARQLRPPPWDAMWELSPGPTAYAVVHELGDGGGHGRYCASRRRCSTLAGPPRSAPWAARPRRCRTRVRRDGEREAPQRHPSLGRRCGVRGGPHWGPTCPPNASANLRPDRGWAPMDSSTGRRRSPIPPTRDCWSRSSRRVPHVAQERRASPALTAPHPGRERETPFYWRAGVGGSRSVCVTPRTYPATCAGSRLRIDSASARLQSAASETPKAARVGSERSSRLSRK
jgi:hypothetical protein